VSEADEAGWIVLRVMMDSPQLAKMLVFGLGTQCEVLDPPELAAEVLGEAQALVEHLRDKTSGQTTLP
jgi:predicted DNA-binding transcriptional regulator YafY